MRETIERGRSPSTTSPHGLPAFLERLAQSGYYLGQAVIDAVLAEAGE